MPFLSLVPELLLGLWKLHKEEKYYRAAAGVACGSYVAFFGGFSVIGGAMLAATQNVWISLATALCGSFGMVAASAYRTLKKQGIWDLLKIELPKGLAEAIEQTDVTKP
jgi:hypothetical protein